MQAYQYNLWAEVHLGADGDLNLSDPMFDNIHDGQVSAVALHIPGYSHDQMSALLGEAFGLLNAERIRAATLRNPNETQRKGLQMMTITDGTADPLSMQFDRGTGITDRETYERDLRDRQRRHMEAVRQRLESNWQPCLHDACTECVGTGVKRDGSLCIHGIACPCPKHSIRC